MNTPNDQTPTHTRAQWQKRLMDLACEAGESDLPNLELGFLILYRATKLPPLIRRHLANAAVLHLSVIEDASNRRKEGE